MKDIPLYEVRKIRDLRDMLGQSAELYGDRTAFMVKKEPPLAEEEDEDLPAALD